jgi:serine protease Do
VFRWISTPVTIVFLAVAVGIAGPSAAWADQGPLTKDPVSFRDVVKKVLPAVVSIEPLAKPQARAAARLPDGFPRDFFRGLPFPDVDAEGELGQPDRPVRIGTGSGFIVDPAGVVVTNYHVVKGADQVEVRLKDGRQFIARDIKSDPLTDVAILRIDAKDLPALSWGDSAAMEIGDRVLAVGAPFGLTGSVTHGIVSGKGRALNLHKYEDFVQTDAAINPGNSGGPLVNLDGQVVGVNSVIKSRSGGFQGVGLAISSNLARKVADALSKNGSVKRGYLGIRVGDLEPAVAERMGLKDGAGALVAEVVPNSPAEKAGLKDGDVITALAGKPVKSAAEVPWAVAGLPVGQPADITVLRDGKPHALKVTIGEQPRDLAAVPSRRPTPTDGDAVRLDKIGAWVTDFTPEKAEQYGFRDQFPGALIVRSEGLGALAGLRQGSVIVKVDNKPVTSAKEAADAVGAGSLAKGILMQVRSAHGGTAVVLIRSSEE